VGLVYALAAYLSWGLVVPLHFRLLSGFSPWYILAERIVGRHYPLYREPESHHAPFRLQQRKGRAA